MLMLSLGKLGLVAGVLLVFVNPLISQMEDWYSFSNEGFQRASEGGFISHHSILMVGDPPITVDWYQGELPESFQPGDEVPHDSVLILSETFSEPEYYEEDLGFYSSRLKDYPFTHPIPIWCMADNGEELVVKEYPVLPYADTGEENSAPEFDGWGLLDSYAKGAKLAEVEPAPYLRVSSELDFSVAYYRGEPGDTSTPVGGTLARSSKTMPRVVYLHGIELKESMRIWARISSPAGTVDTPTVELNIVDSRDLEQVGWYERVGNVNPGQILQLDSKLNEFRFGLTYEWYWGTSGDTSQPIVRAENSLPQETGSILFEVPEERSSFWLRIKNGDQIVLDSPSAVLDPVEIEKPRILDQPNDKSAVDMARNGVPFSVVAVGGNLNYAWFQGMVGDEYSSPLWTSPPSSRSNRKDFYIIPTSDSIGVWLKIWNDLGTVNSRQVRIYRADIKDVSILEYPRVVRLKSSDLDMRGFRPIDLFRIKVSSPVETLELWHESSEGSIKVASSNANSRGDYLYVNLGGLEDSMINLESGTYHIRAGIRDSFIKTGPIEFINEIQVNNGESEGSSQGGNRTPAVHLIRSGDNMTRGGYLQSVVHINVPYERDSQSLYKGLLGDRSQPVDFETDQPELPAGFNQGKYQNSRVEIKWIPEGQDPYWFEVMSSSGTGLRCIVRYPGEYEIPGEFVGNTWHMNLPAGVAEIPIPSPESFPAPESWRYLHEEQFGETVELPVDLGDFQSPNLELAPWNTDEGGSWSININLDPELPPQVLNKTPSMAVLPDGTALEVGDVIGDVDQTRISISEFKAGPWSELKRLHGAHSGGFSIPESAKFVKLKFVSDVKAAEFIFPVTRIPGNFSREIDYVEVIEGSLLTHALGVFRHLHTYPWILHTEMGWWYVKGAHKGVFVFTNTTGEGYDWNWTSSDVFPFFFNYTTGSWKYYWVNSFGWFNDYETDTWYAIE